MRVNHAFAVVGSALVLGVVACGGNGDADDGAAVPPGVGGVSFQANCVKSTLGATLTSSELAFSVRYPTPWKDATSQKDAPRLTRTTEDNAFLAGSRFYLGDETQQPLVVLRGFAGDGIGAWQEMTIAGRPAASWWDRKAAPAPGSGPSGPELVRIGVGTSMGGREILVVTGTAPVTASAQVFCDIQEILASFVPSK
jgi:hypothetical protein